MKCQCGNPMRQQIISWGDVWWTCMICGRMTPGKQEPMEPIIIYTEKPVENTQKYEVLTLSEPVLPVINYARRDFMGKQLIDLNDSLFSQLDRLSSADVTGDKLKEEIERSRAVIGVAREIISNGRLALDAQKEFGEIKKAPKMLGIEHQ
jgi:hypothetical protein